MSSDAESSRSSEDTPESHETASSDSSMMLDSGVVQEILAGRVSTLTTTKTLHVGPLPPPEILVAYGEVDRSLPERIVRMAELQADHRRDLERKELDASIQDLAAQRTTEHRGQMFALLVCLSFLACGVYVTLNGHDWVGGLIVGATLLGLVTVFVTGRRFRSIQDAAEEVEKHRS